MKTTPLLLLLLTVSLPAAAIEPFTMDDEGIREMVKSMRAQAPAPVPETAPAACSGADLDGAELAPARFSGEFAVSAAGRETGAVRPDGDGYVYEAGGAVAARIAVAVDGAARTATITGCGGEVVGRIVETDEQDDADYPGSSSYRFEDAAGRALAESCNVVRRTWSAKGDGVSARISRAPRFMARDGYALSLSGIDGRLVMAAALLNDQARERAEAQYVRQHPSARYGH